MESNRPDVESVIAGTSPRASIGIISDVPDRGRPETTTTNSSGIRRPFGKQDRSPVVTM